MSQEQNSDLISWWAEQSFPGKELYKMEENGNLLLCTNNNIKERLIASITAENRNIVIRNLQEKFPEIEAKVKDMEIEWLETEDKQKLADKVAVTKEYLHHVNALGDFEKLASLVRDWEHTLYQLTEENYTIKLRLTEMAESLVQSDQWKETTQAFKEIADKWKHTGQIDKNRSDKLWNRIEAARKAFHERKRLQNDEDEKDLLLNLDLKIDLVEQAEAIASSEDWKTTSEAFHRLTDEWKTIGRTPNKKNEELWQRFLAAKAVFFEKKRAHFNKIQEEQEHNYVVKSVLLEKAETLKDSTDWGVTSQAFAALMEQWKKTEYVPQQKGDELWKKFTAAQEYFFDAKRKHTEDIRKEQEGNYNLKKTLLDRSEQLKNSNHWGEASAEFNEMLDEWKKIGPVPRAHSNKIWEDFLAARKHFFARKDANREQRKQYILEQKAIRIEQARGMIDKLKADLKEEEEKIIDFKNALENITPGKKAGELRSHLEKLIADSMHHVKRLQEKLALAAEGGKHTQKDGEKGSAQGHTTKIK